MASASDLGAALGGWFTIADLKDKPAFTVTIAKAGIKAIGQDKEDKPCLEFLEVRKGLVLNATRVQQLKDLFGDEDLVGKKIKLSVREVTVRGSAREMIAIDPVD